MKNRFGASALALLTFAAAALPMTAAAETASGTSRAKILKAITVTPVSEFDFGTITSSPTAGTVQVLWNGARTCSAGVTCAGATTSAGWEVNMTGNQWVYWNGTPNVTLSNGTATMNVSLLNLNSIHMMPPSGIDTIHIGAILDVGANQADGNYTGTFTVDFSYP